MIPQKTVTNSRMFVSLWIGIMLAGGQTGCTTTNKTSGPDVLETRRAVAPGADGIVRGLRNGDYYQIPKVPPPGVKTTYNSVSVSQPYIAMTFDDGPHATFTPRLLDILKERNIKATFFLVGQNAREYPAIVRRILAEGHELGNHTWDHGSLSSMSAQKVHDELAKTHQAVLDASGYNMRIMRPPYGATNARVKQQCWDEFGYATIIWSVDPFDWKRPGSKVVEQRILSGVHPGAIILAHDIHGGTIDAMPDTLDALLSKGYRFVTVSQLLNLASTSPAPAAHTSAAPPAEHPAPAPAHTQPSVAAPAGLPAPATTSFQKGQPPVPGGIPSEGAKAR
jgi:peptidoglycan/xylan/chitin deacetylase (PgdA/CDA1 family)